MDRKIRVGAVSYLNTKPLIYGFEQDLMKEELELEIDYPSNIAGKLINDQIDIGLVPVAILPQIPHYQIISDYCISSDGEVASVCLFSNVPLQEIKTILLDYQSRTSVALLKILLKEYWKISPELVEGDKDYEKQIKGDVAGLVIGDRAFYQRKVSAFIFDLGEAWKNFTGKPFVFAAWVSNKSLPAGFIKKFNEANQLGFDNMEILLKSHPFDLYDLESVLYKKHKI